MNTSVHYFVSALYYVKYAEKEKYWNQPKVVCCCCCLVGLAGLPACPADKPL